MPNAALPNIRRLYPFCLRIGKLLRLVGISARQDLPVPVENDQQIGLLILLLVTEQEVSDGG